jgi:hypothetical protein
MHSPNRIVVVATAMAVAACQGPDIPAPSVLPVPIETSAVVANAGFGLNVVGLLNSNWSDTDRRRVLGFARQMGVRYVRLPLSWDDLQHNGPAFDAAKLAQADSAIQAIVDSSLVPFVTVQGTTWWGRNCASAASCDSAYMHRPTAPNMWWYWQQFVQGLVLRYDGVSHPLVTYWGIGNEPNEPSLWIPDAAYGGDWLEAYIFQFLYAVDVIQPATGRIVVAPDLADGFAAPSPAEPTNLTPERAFERFVNALGFRMRPQDIISTHEYGSHQDLIQLLNYYDSILIAALMPNHHWVTELGWGTAETSNSDQAIWSTNLFRTLPLGQLPTRVKTLYKFHLWEPAGFDLHLLTGVPSSPSPRPAWYCLQAIAAGTTLPNYCS